jgi:hypothetical protein
MSRVQKGTHAHRCRQAIMRLDAHLPHILIGAASSNSIGCDMKISRAFRHKPRISCSASCTCFPGRLPRTSSSLAIILSRSKSCAFAAIFTNFETMLIISTQWSRKSLCPLKTLFIYCTDTALRHTQSTKATWFESEQRTTKDLGISRRPPINFNQFAVWHLSLRDNDGAKISGWYECACHMCACTSARLLSEVATCLGVQ